METQEVRPGDPEHGEFAEMAHLFEQAIALNYDTTLNKTWGLVISVAGAIAGSAYGRIVAQGGAAASQEQIQAALALVARNFEYGMGVGLQAAMTPPDGETVQ